MLKNMKLRKRFTVIMVVVYVISLPVMITGSYYILKQNAVREILEESNLLLAAMEGGKYTGEVVTYGYKELPNRFVSKLSATFVARHRERIGKSFGYSFRRRPWNPLNLEYKAVHENEDRRVPDGQTDQSGGAIWDTGSFYVVMRPVEIKPDCLRCHGDPSVAPPEVREKYGTTNGYGWKVDEIQTVNSVYVPADVPIQNARKALALFSLIYSGFFFVVIIVIDRLIIASIIKPIEQFVEAANEISRGRFEREFSVKTNDEIKTLADAFTRMKLSLAKAMDIITKKK